MHVLVCFMWLGPGVIEILLLKDTMTVCSAGVLNDQTQYSLTNNEMRILFDAQISVIDIYISCLPLVLLQRYILFIGTH